MNKPRVYITQMTNHDMAPATLYGEPIVLLTSQRDQSFTPQITLKLLRDRLKDFCDDDYLLLIGDPVAMALAVNAAAEINDGFVTVLKWSKHHNGYFPIEIDFNERG